MRLSQLVRLAKLTEQVTIITDGGRQVAAIVPAAAARGNAEAGTIPMGAETPATPTETPATRTETVAAGWMRRLDAVRRQLTAQHAAEQRVLTESLAQAWMLLDRLRPPGADATTDRLRAAHRQHLDRSEPRARAG